MWLIPGLMDHPHTPRYHGPMTSDPTRQALRRSFDVYYRDQARTARMDALNAQLIPDAALVFDIGAHVGDRTGSFLRLGAKTVALEPQPLVHRALRLLYGRCEKATLLPMACGAETGQIDLHVNSANPTVSTAAPDFITASTGAAGWEGQVWDQTITVPVTTLDTLIDTYGTPDFVKIDVEGHEPAVLAGLSTALPLLSFEITTIQKAAGLACIDRLSALADYSYSLSLGEEHQLQDPTWISPDAMRDILTALPHAANSGDIYAKRV